MQTTYIYAILNTKNICMALDQSETEIDNVRYILVDSFDLTIVGKEYKDGQFVAVSDNSELNEVKDRVISLENQYLIDQGVI